MNVLALDTTCEYLSVAVEAGSVRYCSDRLLGLKHSEHLLPAVESLMREAGLGPKDLDLVVCAQGPGSFTGLRIGMATAKGLADGADVPLVSVPSTEMYAAPFSGFPGLVVPVIDAKKGQVYLAVYVDGQPATEVLDLPPEQAAVLVTGLVQSHGPERQSVVLAGPHPTLLSPSLPGVMVAPYGAWASAIALIDLGKKRLETTGPDQDLDGPVYIRKSEAELKA